MPDARPAAVVMAPEAPYPLAGGGAMRTASLLHYLAGRYDVDLVAFRQPGGPHPSGHLPQGLVRRLHVIELPANGRSPAARVVRNAGRLARRVPPLVDRFAGFASETARFLSGRSYDLAVIEHFWCAPYFDVLAPCARRVVLDLHNVESVLHARGGRIESYPASLAHRIFERACRELERKWLHRYDTLLVTSPQDARFVHALAPSARVIVYPNAIPSVPLPPPGDDFSVVFSGNLEYHPNIAAVRWFAAEIWPALRRRWPALKWRLVGRNPEVVARFVSGDPRIEVTGAVPDAIVELARSRIAVVPLLAGSGTRIKIMEAWAAGLPVVSTTIGAEGLPVHHNGTALLADTPAEFAEAVSRLLECEKLRQSLAAAGRALFEQSFTWEAAWQHLDL